MLLEVVIDDDDGAIVTTEVCCKICDVFKLSLEVVIELLG